LNFKILVHHFLRLCLLYIIKKFDSIRTKLTEEIDFKVCPYGDSGNGTATAARRSLDIVIEPAAWRRAAIEARGHSELRAFGTGGIRNWGHNRAVKTHRLVKAFGGILPTAQTKLLNQFLQTLIHNMYTSVHCIPAEEGYKSSAVAEMGDHLVTIDMDRTLGVCHFGRVRAASPPNTM